MPSEQLRVLASPSKLEDVPSAAPVPGNRVLDEVLGQLAELVAERIVQRLAVPESAAADEWLDTRRAAEYLGIHRDRLRQLAAEGVIPSEQENTGCKLYFRRSALDAWRCPGSAPVVPIRGGCHG
jgi:excisionase family DNA binding protein